MTTTLDTLVSARLSAWERLGQLRDEVGERTATAEQRRQWNAIESELNRLGVDIQRAQATTPVISPVAGPMNPADARYEQAFRTYLRGGTEGMDAADRGLLTEHRAQAEGTTTAGGYLVPTGWLEKLTETMKAYGGLLSQANVIRTATGQPLQWPSNDDTSHSGAILSENTQISEVDVAFGQRTLNAWTYTSNLILASLQLVNDSAFDLDTWLPTKIGQRIGRAVANHLINGTGSSQPTGLLTSVRTGVTGSTGSTTSVTYNNLVDLTHTVDAAYRQQGNCRWLLNDATLGAIRKIADTNGRPLWTPPFGAFDQANPETILGYPVQVDNSMPVMAANAKSIVFGDLKAGYIVRQVLDTQVVRLVERYADYLQIGFFGYARLDGSPDDLAATAAYVNSAT